MERERSLDDWLDYQINLHEKAIDLGLTRIRRVYQALFPQGLGFKTIVVAGTNGKGSTCAFIEAIYQQSNHKIGKFSSPHIQHYNERFRINGTLATDNQICTAFMQIEQARGAVSLSYFEFSTLAALLIFTGEKVALAVLEVGLGARLDAVNVVDADVAVITNIALEHTDYLGATREQIGFEKSGIMRHNKPCICADTQPPKSIQQQADKLGAKLQFIPGPYLGEIGLLGEYQRQNAATAIDAVGELQDILPVSRSMIEAGIKNVALEARFQLKTIANKTLVLDVAHNPAAVAVLAAELAKDKRPTLAIFSAMKDKNIGLMIGAIRPIIDKWLLTPLNTERAIRVQNLSREFKLGAQVKVCKSPQQALKLALDDPTYSRVVVFGSFYLIGDIIKAIDMLN